MYPSNLVSRQDRNELLSFAVPFAYRYAIQGAHCVRCAPGDFASGVVLLVLMTTLGLLFFLTLVWWPYVKYKHDQRKLRARLTREGHDSKSIQRRVDEMQIVDSDAQGQAEAAMVAGDGMVGQMSAADAATQPSADQVGLGTEFSTHNCEGPHRTRDAGDGIE